MTNLSSLILVYPVFSERSYTNLLVSYLQDNGSYRYKSIISRRRCICNKNLYSVFGNKFSLLVLIEKQCTCGPFAIVGHPLKTLYDNYKDAVQVCLHYYWQLSNEFSYVCFMYRYHLAAFCRNVFFQWLFQPIQGPPRLLTQFRHHFLQSAGLLGRVTTPSQGRYLNTGQHKYRINAHTDIPALSGIRTHDPIIRGSEDSSCLRPRGYCDRLCRNTNDS
jgi:hypothetical protein